jgi:hypothetical protein
MHHKLTKYCLLVAASLSLSFALNIGKAHAAPGPMPQPTNTIPAAGDYEQGSRVNLITAIYGNGYVLRSPQSVVRLYSGSDSSGLPPTATHPNTTPITFHIINGGNCPGTGGDVGPNNSQTTTTFYIYSLNPNPNPDYLNSPFLGRRTLLKKITSTDDILCSPNYTFQIKNLARPDPVPNGPGEGKFGYEIEADMDGGFPGWNMFKYQVDPGGGRFSFYSGSTNQFALKAADTGGSPGDPGDFRLGFAPGCGLHQNQSLASIGKTASLDFYDPDAGQSNQNGETPVHTVLYEFDMRGNLTRTVPLDTTVGNDAGGSFDITNYIQGYHKYEWVWQHIYSANGIQFQMPYDSFSTFINFAGGDCNNEPPPAFACTPLPVHPTGSVPINHPGYNFDVKVTNTGDGKSTTNYKLERDRYINGALSGVSQYDIADNLAARGGTDSVNNIIGTINAANGYASGDVVKFVYLVHHVPDPGYLGSCQFTFTVGIGPTCAASPDGCGVLSANCSTINITGVNVFATTDFGGHHIIRKVPVAIVISNLTNPSEPPFTYVIPNSDAIINIKRGGSGQLTTPLNTFQIPGYKMYPHMSYAIQLYMQGTGSPTQNSATYPDNGSWYTGVPFPPNWYTVDPIGSPQLVRDCLDAQCVGPSTVDAEPGARVNITYTVRILNKTKYAAILNNPATDPTIRRWVLQPRL